MTGVQESTNLCANYFTKFLIDLNGIWNIKFHMTFVIHLSCPIGMEGRKYFYDFCTKRINIGLYSNIYRLMSFKLGMIIKTSELYIFVSVWMTLTFIQGHGCVRKKVCVHFLSKLDTDLNEFQDVATTCWFVGAHAEMILHSRFKGGNSTDVIL